MPLKDFTQGSNDNTTSGGPNSPIVPLSTLLSAQGGTIDDNSDDAMSLVIDYNEKFKTAGPASFREGVLKQLMSVLIGNNKPNALLVGLAGTGKTRIVEDLAWRLANNDPLVPDVLQGYTVYELPLTNLVAGSSLVGELEEKTKALLDTMSDPANKAILFIDEIHQLMGDSQVYGKIAQMLKPALARGDIRVIGATTSQEANDLTHDPAFSRRFTRVIVDELTRAQTIEVMHDVWPTMFAHYKNAILMDDDAFDMVARMADQFSLAGSHRPDNAITLLDRACADAVVEETAREAAVADQPKVLAALKAARPIPITEHQVRKTAISIMTGHARKDRLNVDALTESLSEIHGQDDTVSRVIAEIRRDDLALWPRKKPLTFLLAGPSGVGKTAITKAVAREMTGSDPITLNMTEYSSPETINRIIGSPPGYVGSDSHAELPFDALETNPYQVILLDEIEKGDRSVQRLFMSAFDEGYIQTATGKTVDFSKAIIFATTNAAHSAGSKNACGFTQSESKPSQADLAGELSHWFDAEFLNRFKIILTLSKIDKATYTEILQDKYARELERLRAESHPVADVLPDKIPADELKRLAAETYIPAFGARPAQRCIRTWIEEQALAQS